MWLEWERFRSSFPSFLPNFPHFTPVYSRCPVWPKSSCFHPKHLILPSSSTCTHSLPSSLCAVPLSCSEGFTELGYYNGTVSQTDSGAPCLKWTEFPDYVMQYPGRGLGDHSYCRNPDRESNPWCFFRQNSGAIGWAYCDCHQGRAMKHQDVTDPGPVIIIILLKQSYKVI